MQPSQPGPACGHTRRTSFFLWRMPSLRHDTAFVTAIGGFTEAT
jgi:hypothetical protein